MSSLSVSVLNVLLKHDKILLRAVSCVALVFQIFPVMTGILIGPQLRLFEDGVDEGNWH